MSPTSTQSRAPLLSDRDADLIGRALAGARAALLAECRPEGCWVGELSHSALATATAVSALCLAGRERHGALVSRGVAWLAGDQNPDGGWGDTPDSPSNPSTTLLAAAALRLAGPAGLSVAAAGAERFLAARLGPPGPSRAQALCALYGADRTFAAPILANGALAGAAAWADVPSLPLELACLPRAWLRAARLHVVSYALPALIAVGELVHARRPPRSLVLRLLRDTAARPALRLLERIQPAGGGYLEAVPLTSFVVMSLAGAGRGAAPVVERGLAFLERSARACGAWPIDVNLSCWLTTMAVAALDGGVPDAQRTRRWLLAAQHTRPHPCTGAPPGGWAWTDLPGGVPDVDDTAGALLALRRLGEPGDSPAVRAGVQWLLGRQNRDGGWPTFCRGWGRLPFDRSAPDLTAHAVRALSAWPHAPWRARAGGAVGRGLNCLRRCRRADGAWVPLWFGNQHAQDAQSPVYGTARVLAALQDLGLGGTPEARRGAAFLAAAQGEDGAWPCGPPGAPATIEETALAVGALCQAAQPEGLQAAGRGALWLAARVLDGALERPAPIGLYFARLWYSERLYPVIWTAGALGRMLEGRPCGRLGIRRAANARSPSGDPDGRE